ncbi:ThuA domain-containing protein [Neolewinella lacunae]|uniref:ThuA domain-containing protein n=1 Tax=Neolewinella lacunae TaxID=1517758 RepID=A0A923T6J0_9BACT|nr:ThuA domain-containing protein [Neolewinella lacunae]MBC6993475.1 ThuA domain-containing protein [Neolewinella lacunae]MDN3636249.1 ThuA domain-containing protein [Neolewinella lacunae]
MKASSFFLSIGLLAVLLLSFGSCQPTPGPAQLLVFSKTEGFRHTSIAAGVAALTKMAEEKGFTATFTEDADLFTDNNLRNYRAVVFLNTTGDVLNPAQQIAFERFIQAGGGYVGVHAATDTEYDWPWYGQLAGAYFLDHPSTPSNLQEGTFHVLEKDHWATQGMPDTFKRTDEFYAFRNISKHIHPVLEIDNESYVGGSNPDFHPMSWYQEFDGGRSFYTAMGHTDETYSEPLFLDHLWAGINYAMGGDDPAPLDYEKSRPEENRFSKEVLADKLDEPMELTLLDEERILFIQRKGEVRLYNLATAELKTIANLPVSLKYVDKDGKESVAEDGLLGLNKDPNFAENHWIYLFYSPVDTAVNRLSRFEMNGDELLLDSEKIMLEIGVQREQCCHTGGSIDWDAAGNLYLSTGDNTNPHGSNGYSPSDERPGRSAWDAQKSSANTNDLRGKILRIHPEADGSYTIPEGNLFPAGTANTRPEIYTMGHRNPFRISVDQKTGYVYWGDVGPDANEPNPERGPAGHDEVGQARSAGNFGWPHFVGDNKAYHKYDFANEKSLPKWDAAAPTNTSPNNTGLQELPPAQPAFVWYPYGASPEFPLLGSGGRNAMAGPVYYQSDFANAERPFPAYYDGKLLAYEWMRGIIYAVKMDAEGNLLSMDRFMPSYTFSNPMDMVFAANGDLFMLEYGTGWFTQNDDARLVRISYNAGNRPPKVELIANTAGGSAPLALELNAGGTSDPDNDELKFTWNISNDAGFKQHFTTEEAALTLTEKGVYKAELTVDDGNGGQVTQALEIVVGNEKPIVDLTLPNGNASFFVPGQPILYDVQVTDAEDGKLDAGIAASQVAFSIDYLAEGYDKVIIEQGHRGADAGAKLSKGAVLIGENDCISCHKVAEKSIGPNYTEIATRYAGDANAEEYLTGKIIAGGSGVWGETAMAAHPELATSDAVEMVQYILSLAKKSDQAALPLKGSYLPTLPEGDPGMGVFILRAAYLDRGTDGLPALGAEKTLVLRNANINPHSFTAYQDVRKLSFGGRNLLLPEKSGAYALLSDVSLAGISAISLVASAPVPMINAVGGTVELHLDTPDGPLLGTSPLLKTTDQMPGQSAAAPPLLTVPLTLPTGTSPTDQHDLYFVFKSPDGADGVIMVVMGVMVQLDQKLSR